MNPQVLQMLPARGCYHTFIGGLKDVTDMKGYTMLHIQSLTLCSKTIRNCNRILCEYVVAEELEYSDGKLVYYVLRQ